MSWQTRDACYPTQQAAVQAAASGEVGKVVTLGSVSYVVDVTATTATTATYVLRRMSGTPDITKVTTINVQPCQLLDGPDGLLLGWVLIGVWVATYAIRYLARLVK